MIRDGFALPVAQALLTLLSQEVAHLGLNLERLTQLTFKLSQSHLQPRTRRGSPRRDTSDTRS